MTALMPVIESVTTDPLVRSWFPSQPVPLNPLAVPLPGVDGRVLIHLLLTTREDLGGNDFELVPGAFFCWEWPSWKLAAMINLDVMPGLPEVRLHPGHAADPAFVERVERACRAGSTPPVPGSRVRGVYDAISARLDPAGLRYRTPLAARRKITLKQALEAAQKAMAGKSGRLPGPESPSSVAQRLSARDGADDTLDLTDFIRKMEDR
ncbi:MAG: hypothetical protein V2B18_04725 [Pseudomonadota bacterium]